MKILLTGFEPFGGDVVNPSWEIARALDGSTVAGAQVVACQLPCVFGRAPQVLRQALAQGQGRWALVVALGMAGSRTGLSFERIAINLDDASSPDNAGQQPVDEAVLRLGPAAYFSTLPVKRMVDAVRAAGIAADTSQTAGTFVCNHVFYRLMHTLADMPNAPRAGFIHVPVLPEQQALHPLGQAMALDMQMHGVRVALQAALSA
jgi:pyroglutamyl-peptidase